jgi:hypothetical protein
MRLQGGGSSCAQAAGGGKGGADWACHGSPTAISMEHAVITLGDKNTVRVWLTFPNQPGPDHVHTWLAQLVREPLWGSAARLLFLMTGVCAGERGKCRLGDLMVAEAFTYEAGKSTNAGFQPAPRFSHPSANFLHWLETKMTPNWTWTQRQAFPDFLSDRDILLRLVFSRDQTRQLEKWIVDANNEWLRSRGLQSVGPLLRGLPDHFFRFLTMRGPSPPE